MQLKSMDWQKISCKFLQMALVTLLLLHYFKANRNKLSNDYLKQCAVCKLAYITARLLPKHDCQAIQQIAILGMTIFKIIRFYSYWLLPPACFKSNGSYCNHRVSTVAGSCLKSHPRLTCNQKRILQGSYHVTTSLSCSRAFFKKRAYYC